MKLITKIPMLYNPFTYDLEKAITNDKTIKSWYEVGTNYNVRLVVKRDA